MTLLPVGTRPYVRLVLRRDRLRLTLWFGLTALLLAAEMRLMVATYPTPEIRRAFAALSNATPAQVFLLGPLTADSGPALAAWRVQVISMLFLGLASALTVLRHTRREEDEGRRELLGAAVVAPAAPLVAALLVTALANGVAAVAVVLAQLAWGWPVEGAVVFGVQMVSHGLLLAGVAAVAAQLWTSPRAAAGVTMGLFTLWYFLLGTAQVTTQSWPRWLSPLAWVQRGDPYGADRLLPLVPAWGLTVVLVVAAGLGTARRDVGGSLLRHRRDRTRHRRPVTSPAALVWRLQRGLLVAWTTAAFAVGALIGAVADNASSQVAASPALKDLMGGAQARLGFIGAAVYLATQLLAIAAVQLALRLRSEEVSGRTATVLGTPVSRTRWVFAHLVVAWLGVAVVLATFGLGVGLGLAGLSGDGGDLGRGLAAAAVRLPALALFAALAVLAYAVRPGWAPALSYGTLLVVVLLELLTEFRLTGRWVLRLSPFQQLPQLPVAPFALTPVLAVSLLAVLLGGLALMAFRRRDLTV
ncbi:MAG: transporter permease [Friedmanniella sp.]|nr:transporter permease [Friedmanniella sp.]